MVDMKAFLICFLSVLLLAACSSPEMLPPLQPTALLTRPANAATSAAPALKSATPAPVQPTPAPGTPSQTPIPQQTSLPATVTQSVVYGTGIVLTRGALTVQIESPADGATIKESRVDVKGQAPKGTVISVDDVVLVVDASARFSVPVELQKGPNLVEFVASDSLGNQVFYPLALYCDP